MPRFFGLVSTLLFALGCAGPEGAHRFRTPEATVRSLFTAYGVEDVPEHAILARLGEGGRFVPEDVEGARACFADLRGPEDDALAGYVFGALAAGKDRLRFERAGDRATVLPTGAGGPDAPRVVLRRSNDQWKIVLRESVPADVRGRLLGAFVGTPG